MSWGSNNEYFIFPIIDLVQKEVKSMISRGIITQDSFISPGDTLIHKDERNNTIEYNTNLLSRLESNDYTLTLEKNDPDNPNKLTGVVIDFGGDLREVISLIRENNKLMNVKIALIIKEPMTSVIPNPLGMSGTDYVEYLLNKRYWTYYRDIYDDENSTPEAKNNALIKMTFYNTRNDELRRRYSVEDNLPYEELIKYVPNPLGMTVYDYVRYVHNKWIYISPHPAKTQEDVERAILENQQLRDTYFIAEDIGEYAEFAQYLPNPLCMQPDVFERYMRLRAEFLTLTDPELIAANEAERRAMLDELFIVEDNYTYEELTQYLQSSQEEYLEKMLLKIVISLHYNVEGKFIGVTSETQEGE